MGRKVNLLLVVIYFGACCNPINARPDSSTNIDSLKNKLITEEISEKQRAEMLILIARAYKNENDFVNAIKYYKEAQIVNKSIKNPLGLGNTYEAIGDIYSEINDFGNAIENYQEAIYVYDNANLFEQKANLSISFADIYLKLDKYDKSIQFLNDSKIIFEKHPEKFPENLITTYIMLGSAFGYKEQLDSALVYFEKAMGACKKTNNTIQLGGVMNNIGAIYSKMDLIDSASHYYVNALELFKKINLEKGIAVTLNNMALLSKKQNKLIDAIQLYSDAIGLLHKTNDLAYLKDAYLNMSDIYKIQNNYKEAFHYLQAYQKINDSLFNIDEMGKIANSEMQYNIRKRDNEFQKLQQENELNEKDIRIRKKTQYALIAGIVLILIIAFLILRNLRASIKNTSLKQLILEKEKQQLKNEIFYQKKELENFAFRIIEKNNFLDQLKQQLSKLNHHTDSEKLKDIARSVDQNLYIDKDLQEFELKAEDIHHHFFQILKEKYPDLTKTDRKLCSLILIGIGSKEIASIFNISPDGVKKARYRLRKKFELENEEDLYTFLNSLS